MDKRNLDIEERVKILNLISDYEKIDKLINYYKDKGLLIVGLNDSQGVNTTSMFCRKGLLDYLALSLTSDELKPEVINAFSLTMNKTEHIDYFLKNNLSVEEIKLSQLYSAVSAFEKVMQDIGLPKSFGKVANIYKFAHKVKPKDKDIRISTSIQMAKEPIMIYSSGVNDLMREVGANPFGIKKDYKDRNKKPNYYYTLEKVNNKNTLNKVIDSIERNYNNILGINNSTDIYTLGAYVPKSLQKEEMNIFRDLVIRYNEKLSDLCKQYKTTFIDTEKVGKEYNNSENNFHISATGHNALANTILGHIYNNCNNKILSNNENSSEYQDFTICDKGAKGVCDSLMTDYRDSVYDAMERFDYEYKRGLEIADEHKREFEIFQKVLSKKSKNI